MREEPILEFGSVEEAYEWMVNLIDDGCIDNYRFAFQNDKEGMDKYERQYNDGCCGSFDEEVKVNGRLATIGCNYGH